MRPSHAHLGAVLSSLLAMGTIAPRNHRLKILDIGCGDGRLMDHLQRELPKEFPGLEIEVHGFDISDQGHSDHGQRPELISYLGREHPDVDWEKRVTTITSTQEWPYADGEFDGAVSNQVLEHVDDLAGLLTNMRRVVRGGTVHLFPLSSCLIEGHVKVPLAHWIKDVDARSRYISTLGRLGIGRYAFDKQIGLVRNADEYGYASSRFVECYTRYRSFREIYQGCREAGLTVSYAFTKDFLFTKLRTMIGARPRGRYRRGFAIVNWLGFALLQRLSSVTLIIRPVAYDVGQRIRAEKTARLGS